MAKIENMTRAFPVGGKRGGDAGADRVLTREQHRRIEIALKGYAMSDAIACAAEIDCPVNPHRVAAACSQRLEPSPAAFGE